MKLRVIGTNYTVTFPKRLKGNMLGLFHPERELIQVKAGQTPVEEVDTLLHEVIHAIEHKNGVEYKEEWVHPIATGLVAVFRDNPWLLDHLKDKLKEDAP